MFPFFINSTKSIHELIEPEALTTFYVHPIEHILVNVFPILIGLLWIDPHPLLVWTWVGLSTFSAVHNHSGMQYAMFPNPEFHDVHHQISTLNYGISGFFDLLLLHFKDSKQPHTRHIDSSVTKLA